MARQHLIIAHILPVVVLTACAGGVNPHASDFVSDPEPYETWVKPNGTVIAISRNAAIPDPYQSDYISVLVATADQAEFTWYIERLGLAVEERRFTFDEGTWLRVRVPPGSAQDAARKIGDAPGVKLTEVPYIFTIDD